MHMKQKRIPEELEYPVYGMNNLDSVEQLLQHESRQLVNAFPGKHIIPRHGCTEVMLIDSADTEVASTLSDTVYRSEGTGFIYNNKKYIILWAYGTIGGSLKHVIVIHNITDGTTQISDIGSFLEDEIHVSFVKLYKSVYVAIERNYQTNNTNEYRDISKILYIDEDNTWHTREIGINISPVIQSLYTESTQGFGLFGGRSQYGATVFNNEMWVFGGINDSGKLNTLYHSQDGNLWTQQIVDSRELLWSEDDSALLDEFDTQLYSETTVPYRSGCRLIVFGDYMFLIAGKEESGSGPTVHNDVWYTEDGEVWYDYGNTIDFDERYDFGLVEYADKLWIVGGFDSSGFALSDVWSSSDGFTWTEVTQVSGYSARGNHATWTYGGYIWVHGGIGTTDILRTTDGATWEEVAADAGLGQRTGHGVVSYNGYMYLVAGMDTATPQNDVYSSDDGITWTLLTGSAEFSARYNFTLLNFLDELWVICGYTGSTWPEDIYHSNTGSTWTRSSSGIESNQYYSYTWTFLRRTDEYAVLSSIDDFIYDPWETVKGSLIVGVDENLIIGTVSLSSNTLTGTDTIFLTDIKVGDRVRINGTAKYYVVTEVASDISATVINANGDSYSDNRMAVLPSDGDSITTNYFRPGECEGIEDLNYRRVVYTYSATDFCRVFIGINESIAATSKGATHVRVYRTLQGTTSTVAKGLSHRYLVDIALGHRKTYRDVLSDDALAGETNVIEVTGKFAPPAGRFCFWAGGRLWIGGNPDREGFWFASMQPSNTQYPEKYASIFDMNNEFLTCDPEDNQQDTGGFEFLGDAYFCKERKIFRLSNASFDNTLTKISYHIGVACPNSIAFGVDPATGAPAVYFLSETGPAILTAGGKIRLLTEFKIAELWQQKTGVLKNNDGAPTDWHTRNKVFGVFWNDSYWLFYGDSDDTDSTLSANKIYGCHYATDGTSYGAFSVSINQYEGNTIFEPQMIIVYDNITAMAISHKMSGSNWKHRIVQFLDQENFIDTFDEGSVVINTKWEVRPFWMSSLREKKGVADKILLRIKFADEELYTITITADEARKIVANVYTQTTQSGISLSGIEDYRKSIVINLKPGIIGSFFTILQDKVVPTTGVLEIYSPELIVTPIDAEYEFQSSGATVSQETYVENVNETPEVDVFS
jgi:hypothetical protein